MNHGGGHHDMPMDDDMCSMNMIFNWQIKDVCVVFEWWHIRGIPSLLISCLAVFAIAACFEYVRARSSALEQTWLNVNAKKRQDDEEITTNNANESTTLLQPSGSGNPRLSRHQHMALSVIYAFLVAISFWLMLVFMTYNGFLMLAVVLGAGVGHYFFGNGYLTANRSIQCH
ncbi:ctr2p [Lichtheimia corymbifera JMRC:FSU:9682]|uniref:Copper transport protein n=1 Tax=Lichtheimia corymbifera JMRC:FSU:9682 TaxID=1263082 RepID=A0A068RK52_9FUNG|nr:ctr2p [Lichtheimia corymbifera JMRC:FSU:9682]